MRRPLQILKSCLLPLQILLCSIRSRHVARISAESRLSTFRTNVVVRSARVPDDKITGSSVDLLPFATLVLQPLHTFCCETIPLVSPSPDLVWLILEVLVKLFTKKMCTLANDQTTVLITVGEDVDKALKTAKTGVLGVLVLMRPGLVDLDIFAVGERGVDGVERDDEIFGVVDALEGFDDTGFLANGPGEGFVGDAVACDHAFFGDDGKGLCLDGAGVVTLEAHAAVAKSFVSMLFFSSNCIGGITKSQGMRASHHHTSQLFQEE